MKYLFLETIGSKRHVWNKAQLTIQHKGRKVTLPLTFTKNDPLNSDDEYSSEEDDFEEEELLEMEHYYISSDFSEEEEEIDNLFGFNPWANETSPIYHA